MRLVPVLSSNAMLTVTLDHFAWNPIPSPRFVNTPFAVTIRAQDLTNGIFTNFTGTAILGTTNGIAVTPSVSGNFVQGVWTGAVVISQTASNLVLQADDGLGHFGLPIPSMSSVCPVWGCCIRATLPCSCGRSDTRDSCWRLRAACRRPRGSWFPIPPIQIGDQYLLPLDMTGTNGFYRLRFPVHEHGANWLPKCFGSIKAQTILDQIETVMVDNNSTDDSVAVARKLLADFPCACIVRNSENLGFCEGNNSGARVARGRYILFLNNDTWLEPDCMEKLIAGTEKIGAVASTPLVLNYPDNSYQDFGFYGFDIFGLPSPSAVATATREIFIAGGCSYLIRADVFNQLGMFDAEYFIYSDDADLSWRVWLAGYKVAGIFEAKLHHRGAAG
jgi:hypothetical protein